MTRLFLAVATALTLAACAPAQQAEVGTVEAEPAAADVVEPVAYATPAEGAAGVRALLEAGVDTVSAAEAAATFAGWRGALEASGDPTMQVVAIAVEPVEEALEAEPVDEAALVQALQELALSMRTAAASGTPDEQSLIVELASLVDQTADYLAQEGYTPRLEVEAP